MTLKKYFPIAVFIGVQAFFIQIIDQLLFSYVPPIGNAGFGWIAFQAWAVYFMAGGSVKNGMRALIGYVLGMIASIAIIWGAGQIAGGVGFFAVPIVLLILVPCILYLDQAPEMFSFVPAVFVGAGVFFGCMTYVPGATFTGIFVTETIYCIIGLFFGYKTVTFRVWYETKYINSAK